MLSDSLSSGNYFKFLLFCQSKVTLCRSGMKISIRLFDILTIKNEGNFTFTIGNGRELSERYLLFAPTQISGASVYF